MSAWPDPLARFEPFGADAGTLRYLLLDVFTDTPLEGNQLAVFTDARALEAAEMQAIAAELKLSETVFLLPPEQGGDARVRIFTPAAEMPFAGHPVLGCAAVLARALGREEVVVETGAGAIPVSFRGGAGRVSSGEMSQPVPTWAPFGAEAQTLGALGVERSRLPVIEYRNGPRHVMVVLEDERSVAALEPDMPALARAAGESLVSCFSGRAGRFKTRMFAPALGVPEDPATGSAAGPLAVHCALHGLSEFGQAIDILQGLEVGRPSLLRARVEGGAAGIESVRVGGDAVIVARAEMSLG